MASTRTTALARTIELANSHLSNGYDTAWLNVGGALLLILTALIVLGVLLEPRRRKPGQRLIGGGTRVPRPVRHLAEPPTRHRGRPVEVRRKTFVALEPSTAILKGGI